jgi:hypothetical protein
MAELTLTLPDDLAKRVEPLRYLPTILELSLLTLKTPAAQTESEITEFLSMNPSPQAVLQYHGTARAQERVNYLLELNSAGTIKETELQELDELLLLDNTITALKITLKQQELTV